MRKSYLMIVSVLIFGVVFVGCKQQSNEERAKKLIAEWMNENIDDISNYQPVSFSELDSVFTEFIDTDEYLKLFNLASIGGPYDRRRAFFQELANIERDFRNFSQQQVYLDSVRFYINKAREVLALIDEKSEAYAGEFVGWIMTHRFRASNALGAIIMQEMDFYFDKEIIKIVDIDFD